jgi:sortase A
VIARRLQQARAGAGLALLVAAAVLLGDRAHLAVKRQVAAFLIERAFRAHLEDGRAHRPWSWADTWPIARIEVPRLGVSRTVLAGASGGSLAFGPGHVDGTALPGTVGTAVVAGHRDGSFAFLAHVVPGDAIRVVTRDGTSTYRVEATWVTTAEDASVLAPDGPRLHLVTCHPFGGVLPGPDRFVVTAVRVQYPTLV